MHLMGNLYSNKRFTGVSDEADQSADVLWCVCLIPAEVNLDVEAVAPLVRHYEWEMLPETVS